jgi:hypothetical protein
VFNWSFSLYWEARFYFLGVVVLHRMRCLCLPVNARCGICARYNMEFTPPVDNNALPSRGHGKTSLSKHLAQILTFDVRREVYNG